MSNDEILIAQIDRKNKNLKVSFWVVGIFSSFIGTVIGGSFVLGIKYNEIKVHFININSRLNNLENDRITTKLEIDRINNQITTNSADIKNLTWRLTPSIIQH